MVSESVNTTNQPPKSHTHTHTIPPPPHHPAASKAVGEVLVAKALERGEVGGGAVIARLGMVAGDSETGTCNPEGEPIHGYCK